MGRVQRIKKRVFILLALVSYGQFSVIARTPYYNSSSVCSPQEQPKASASGLYGRQYSHLIRASTFSSVSVNSLSESRTFGSTIALLRSRVEKTWPVWPSLFLGAPVAPRVYHSPRIQAPTSSAARSMRASRRSARRRCAARPTRLTGHAARPWPPRSCQPPPAWRRAAPRAARRLRCTPAPCPTEARQGA